MRLWSIHPRYLDSAGLVALWRESLLAKKVLEGKTKGYIHHPQLIRFRNSTDPISSINFYLSEICKEADSRGYHFKKDKIGKFKNAEKICVSNGQLNYEFEHLKKKLWARDKNKFQEIKNIKNPEAHPLFETIKDGVEPWEKIN